MPPTPPPPTWPWVAAWRSRTASYLANASLTANPSLRQLTLSRHDDLAGVARSWRRAWLCLGLSNHVPPLPRFEPLLLQHLPHSTRPTNRSSQHMLAGRSLSRSHRVSDGVALASPFRTPGES